MQRLYRQDQTASPEKTTYHGQEFSTHLELVYYPPIPPWSLGAGPENHQGVQSMCIGPSHRSYHQLLELLDYKTLISPFLYPLRTKARNQWKSTIRQSFDRLLF